MIQSSQPSSLKLTCSALRLQRLLGFLLWLRPPATRPASAVRRLRRFCLAGAPWPNSREPSGCSERPLRLRRIFSRISLKRLSFRLARENTTSRALSWGCDGCSRPKPSCRGDKSSPVWAEAILSQKQSTGGRRGRPPGSAQGLKAARTSKTSHAGVASPEPRRSPALESKRPGSRPPLLFAAAFRKTLNSAPTISSASARVEMSKRYCFWELKPILICKSSVGEVLTVKMTHPSTGQETLKELDSKHLPLFPSPSREWGSGGREWGREMGPCFPSHTTHLLHCYEPS
uniref:Uncharacterized protein n=1 Tax=Laticauda laticaudata TaxID=8630 RepID=A0A8C5WQ24_LATLA